MRTKPITFAILGDSAASGVGDYDGSGRTRGWCVRLANAFTGTINVIHVARPGAQSKEVRETQLLQALAMKPDIAAIVVGGNDALRNGFNPVSLYENLRQTVAAIKERGAEILMLQLHDPTQIVPMPKLLKRVLLRRIDAVNEVYEQLAMEYELILLKTRSLPNIYDLKLWHFDRMHPNTNGHFVLASYFRDALVQRGWKLEEITPPNQREFSRVQLISWMLKNGLPWFFKRSFDLLPAAILLMAMELCRIALGRIGKVIRAI
jgi:lysophospholipase L1-like esterase